LPAHVVAISRLEALAARALTPSLLGP
jgi:hypothetical protein